jgi:Tfp pilus assembly protein PilO
MDKTIKILVILFALAAIALFGYNWVTQWHARTMDAAVATEKEQCQKRIADLEAQIAHLAAQLHDQQASLAQGGLTKSEMDGVFGQDRPESTDCAQISNQVTAFFSYLDSKANVLWPGSSIKAQQLYSQVYRKLVDNPPINVGEMQNLANLTRNVAHLYRVLGKEQIDLIKNILSSEGAVVEPAMSVLFAWMTVCGETGRSVADQKKIEETYPYAAFFLNTMSGRSYLLRRESKLRMLVNYYSVLIIDFANAHKLNSFGLDIRPYLDYLFYDISNQKGLMYRERYLTHLSVLKEKYPQPPPESSMP